MAELFIQGEIYLKYTPLIVEKEDIELGFDELVENNYFEEDISILYRIVEYNNFLDSQVENYNYYGMNYFWQCYYDGDKYYMSACSPLCILNIPYDNFNDINNNFIKLSEFFKKSKFIGREFIRTAPLTDENGKIINKFFMNDPNYKNIVLYATGDLFLVKAISKNDESNYNYYIISYNYISDKKFKFVGPANSDLKDTKIIYSEIVKQCSSINRERKSRK